VKLETSGALGITHLRSMMGVMMSSVTDDTWRPLGVDDDATIAQYDALHDGVPNWMASAFWAWVLSAITQRRRYRDGSGLVAMLDTALVEQMCQQLRIPLPNLRAGEVSAAKGKTQLAAAMAHLRAHADPLQIADYLLAFGERGDRNELAEVLERSKSAWRIGRRAGRDGLERRVPQGVQVAVDAVIQRSGRAGSRLARAWEELHGLGGNPSEAYRLAIQAVEDAAIPVVSPANHSATLGTVIRQMEDQKNWSLPLAREDARATTGATVVALMRMIWHGHHDRHGGLPVASGGVSYEEAAVAVSSAVVLVDWFSAELVQRTAN
jgi:hypothetical protein